MQNNNLLIYVGIALLVLVIYNIVTTKPIVVEVIVPEEESELEDMMEEIPNPEVSNISANDGVASEEHAQIVSTHSLAQSEQLQKQNDTRNTTNELHQTNAEQITDVSTSQSVPENMIEYANMSDTSEVIEGMSLHNIEHQQPMESTLNIPFDPESLRPDLINMEQIPVGFENPVYTTNRKCSTDYFNLPKMYPLLSD
jgi:hypothetical protein